MGGMGTGGVGTGPRTGDVVKRPRTDAGERGDERPDVVMGPGTGNVSAGPGAGVGEEGDERLQRNNINPKVAHNQGPKGPEESAVQEFCLASSQVGTCPCGCSVSR